MTWLAAVALKPLISFLMFGVIALGVRWAVHKWMPECWLKHQLLKHRWGKRDSLCR